MDWFAPWPWWGDGGADLPQDSGLFVDPDVQPLALQIDGKGQTADSRADDGDALGHVSSSRGN